jgi:hypothetical protein
MEKRKDKSGRAKCAAIMRWQNNHQARLSELSSRRPTIAGEIDVFECKAVE